MQSCYEYCAGIPCKDICVSHLDGTFLAKARSWVSPVFLNAAHGRITRGLPVVDANVPLLLVGNHQLLLDC